MHTINASNERICVELEEKQHNTGFSYIHIAIKLKLCYGSSLDSTHPVYGY